jgi:putative protease
VKRLTTVELLAPAGDLEKLETAIAFGADAVYTGGERFGLRAQAGNLTRDQLARARDFCGRRGRRLYLTLNAFLRPQEEEALAAYVEALKPLDLDAYIVADPGVLALVRRLDPQRSLHLSTQVSTTNGEAVRFWGDAGVTRINLARELDLEEIRAIAAAETGVALEVFVHGAMCVAWSGRCLLSAALTGRSANRGACTQPCRWRYALMEESRPGEYFPVAEDDQGTFLFNSRDLCLIENLPELLGAGVIALKIEGRMKSVHYVAAVTRVYRAALDAWQQHADGWRCDPVWLEELDKVSHRPYDRGFLFGGRDALVHPGDAHYRRSCDFLGVVQTVDFDGRGVIAVRGRFGPGEELELIGPAMRREAFTVGALTTATGAPLPVAQPNARVCLVLPSGAQPGDLLRRLKAGDQ